MWLPVPALEGWLVVYTRLDKPLHRSALLPQIVAPNGVRDLNNKPSHVSCLMPAEASATPRDPRQELALGPWDGPAAKACGARVWVSGQPGFKGQRGVVLL